MATPDYYFHYTSRQFAQSVMSAGRLTPGLGGVIYLTRDLYERGTDAMDWLAIDNKPIDVVGFVPGSLVGDLPDEPVFPIVDAGGRLWRKGGGTQIRVTVEVAAYAVKWLALSPP
jgi:hypothetical protein